jgi:hypothetical protein
MSFPLPEKCFLADRNLAAFGSRQYYPFARFQWDAQIFTSYFIHQQKNYSEDELWQRTSIAAGSSRKQAQRLPEQAC